MSISINSLIPAVQAPLERFGQTEWVRELNQTAWLFALVETIHLISLVVLGGAVLVLNLRLLGLVLGDVPEQVIERNTRPWLRAGVIGTIVTGTYMAVATVVTLLPNAAFLVKMVALVAAILLSTAVARRLRLGQSDNPAGSRLLAGSAVALWLAALILFAATRTIAAGALLVGLAGLALLLAGIAVRRDGGNWTALLRSPQRLGAFSSTLAWVTVAAAGRWIGFS
ncbi:hypothetical protein H7F51_07945 [Novosphingobium flavum]|uniref:DUF6644 domain-containing protein n=1 Tax=Novosphingobium flavum TaxID=1778672 RepID=A0A7X1FR49_9SPHN|nr:DUF6644 family protein [Novosphingobium flavum]MBC2665450.1 hypothetical protein [Novosphingobium flavum]